MPDSSDRIYGIQFRRMCMFIGYLHLTSSVADIVYQVLVLGTASNGFQCDVDVDKVREMTSIPMLDSFLLLLNVGTHGFYPYPSIIRNQSNNVFVEYMEVSSVPRCYPGMLHINQIDFITFILNLIWLKFVISYVGALRERNPEPMLIFFNLSIVKLIMQILYNFYQPQLNDTECRTILKSLDGVIQVYFLITVWYYMRYVRAKIERVDKPPSYIECLIGSVAGKEEAEPCAKKEAIINVKDEKKPNLEASKVTPI